METMKQSGLWSSLGTHGFVVFLWWLYISCNGETKISIFLKSNLTWKQCAAKVIEKWGQRAQLTEKHGDMGNFFGVISIILSLLISNLWGHGPCNQNNWGHSWFYFVYYAHCLLHLWSKFGDPRSNRWWVIVQTSMEGHSDQIKQERR